MSLYVLSLDTCIINELPRKYPTQRRTKYRIDAQLTCDNDRTQKLILRESIAWRVSTDRD